MKSRTIWVFSSWLTPWWRQATATTRAWSSSCKRSKADTKPALGSIEGAATQETKAKPGLGGGKRGQ